MDTTPHKARFLAHYDLNDDVGEPTNVAASHPKKVQSMRARWIEWTERNGLIFRRHPTATRPKSIRHAVGVGFVTSPICVTLLIATSGWLFVVYFTGDYATTRIQTLGAVVWPTEESTPAEALKKANELYEGLEDVPENVRAKVLADRILNEEIAQGPIALVFWELSAA